MESVLKDKSFAFAVRVVRLSKMLQEEKKEYIISKQILKSGTAIGALIREAEYGESKQDFIHKLYMSLKEANETSYWLEILKETDYINDTLFYSMNKDVKGLMAMMVSSIKTTKKNLGK